MFSEVYQNQPVRLCIRVFLCPSMCKGTSFCQSAGGVIKSQLVTALVIPHKMNVFEGIYSVVYLYPSKTNVFGGISE